MFKKWTGFGKSEKQCKNDNFAMFDTTEFPDMKKVQCKRFLFGIILGLLWIFRRRVALATTCLSILPLPCYHVVTHFIFLKNGKGMKCIQGPLRLLLRQLLRWLLSLYYRAGMM